ncbi:hypothetical protein O6H91_05G100500 [Diphasiastrum complanatum]|uniref:Uncharacterized protein n=6 Tax=Diphasiastrum complanatum TaxID=34168 RepID=A0ACC2DRT9_DIPCM|nr:hypothetical protein O6H91_05G100500 [Diphasiastrum complanatum]KAJ7556832.1 hypothetical protein O6H91_05G100500 [Diphasiastrum complanatum]KAJ7556833.1 hypothetical protein O6H91_05G100500 [Diphasiastrum complanatum]KAJ7556834.1 hypothetical protein O6H91_05G100500 [Diphasiastrum complanatum]KAJ7556835.1 hypothetical protein O6H91_05G100500 [Diphasiastrum complanatum]
MPIENSVARRGQTPPGGPSTFDLFSWSEGPDASQLETPVRSFSVADSTTFGSASDQNATGSSSVCRPSIRMHQPAGGVSTISFGEKLTLEEAEASLKRRPGSDTKRKEMFGSGIFAEPVEGADVSNGFHTPDRSSARVHQPAGGVSQISFGGDDSISLKKPTSIPEVAKQRELSGSQETFADVHLKRPFSDAKAKELVGSDIFGPPPEIPLRSTNRSLEVREETKTIKGPVEPGLRNVHTSVKVSNPAGGRSQISFGEETAETTARRVHDQKISELTGNNIFKGDSPAISADKPLSVAKLREMSGSDIFADDKPVGRDCVGGIRKPPGGESSIALV